MLNYGLALERAMVESLGKIEGLKGRVCPIMDVHKSDGPLIVYQQRTETERHDLSGRTGLLEADFLIFVLHSTYERMRHLAETVKDTLYALHGDHLRIEHITIELANPDLQELRVSLFRRSYAVKINYQIKED